MPLDGPRRRAHPRANDESRLMTRRNVTIHPAALQRALDAEAEAWARRTDLADWVEQMTPRGNDKSRELLARFAKQCFSEGFWEGGLAAHRGLTLDESLQKAAKPGNDE